LTVAVVVFFFSLSSRPSLCSILFIYYAWLHSIATGA